MDHSEFRIGLEFWCSDRQWRCTDVESRVVVAIRVDATNIASHDGEVTSTRRLTRTEAEEAGWFNGPPYGVAESVFDEDDLDGCSIDPEGMD